MIRKQKKQSQVQVAKHEEEKGRSSQGCSSEFRRVALRIQLRNSLPRMQESQVKTWIEGRVLCLRGHIERAIPLSLGRMLRLDLTGVSQANLDSTIIPALEAHGEVHQMTEEEVRDQSSRASRVGASKKQRAEAVGDIAGATDFAKRLLDLHGGSGKPSKNRRFAERLAGIVGTSQRVASADLREMKPHESDSE